MRFAYAAQRTHTTTRDTYGETVSLVVVTAGGYTPGTGTVAVTTQTVSVLGVAGESQIRDRDGLVLGIRETFCVCSDVLGAVVPKQGDRVIRGGKTSEVTEVRVEPYQDFTAYVMDLKSV